MRGRYVVILILLALAVAGMRHALAQQSDPFERATCQDDFVKLRGEVDKRGLALKTAGEKKASAPEICRLLRNYTGKEAELVKFLADKQAACGVPTQIVNQAKEGHTKALAMRDQVCKVAAGPAAPPPPPPSQGLSGALGSSPFGGPPPEAGGGSGVFDTLTGNVLRQ
ncbi:MAG: hypothetical protein WD871_08710 [Xanthobacteraceae bacterium]